MLKSLHTRVLVLTTSLTQCIKLFLNFSKVLLSYQLVYNQMKALKIASVLFFFPLKCPATKTLGVSCTTHRTLDLRVRRILQRSSGQFPPCLHAEKSSLPHFTDGSSEAQEIRVIWTQSHTGLHTNTSSF